MRIFLAALSLSWCADVVAFAPIPTRLCLHRALETRISTKNEFRMGRPLSCTMSGASAGTMGLGDNPSAVLVQVCLHWCYRMRPLAASRMPGILLTFSCYPLLVPEQAGRVSLVASFGFNCLPFCRLGIIPCTALSYFRHHFTHRARDSLLLKKKSNAEK
jgi:hypothetical protein